MHYNVKVVRDGGKREAVYPTESLNLDRAPEMTTITLSTGRTIELRPGEDVVVYHCNFRGDTIGTIRPPKEQPQLAPQVARRNG